MNPIDLGAAARTAQMQQQALSQMMALRDHFAGCALGAMAHGPSADAEAVATVAYAYADAMLRARSRAVAPKGAAS